MNHQLLMGFMVDDGSPTGNDAKHSLLTSAGREEEVAKSNTEKEVISPPPGRMHSPESKIRQSGVSSETSSDAMDLSSPSHEEGTKEQQGIAAATELPRERGLSEQNRKSFIARKDSENEHPAAQSVKRRKLKRMIARAGGYPSFHLLLSANYDNSDDETPSDDIPPIPIRTSMVALTPTTPHQTRQSPKESQPAFIRREPIFIDLDEELGLKPRKSRGNQQSTVEASPTSAAPAPPPLLLSAADEGYYEGRVDVAISPDDESHLPDLHVWIRRQLEFFTSTDHSVAPGRRSRTTAPGQVGVRCKHCASHPVPPTGAVSYPQSLQGIYMACLQKPQVHFEQHCQSLPQPERDQLQALLASSQPSKPRVRNTFHLEGKGSVPASLYYVVSAKRLGLVQADDGLRFGRDLTLQPLPFETMRLQVEADVSSAASLKNPLSPEPLFRVTEEPRITADDESEQVLAEAVVEPDGLSQLSRRIDKERVTDYFFLIIRQAAICHAIPMDLAGKGKKNKLMRVGFAGFCCRHCQHDPNSAPAWGGCRSFSSAADNLSSSIVNSFALHLQKCPKVPTRIQKAILAYKRLHQRQIAQLPYGSQRRTIYDLWSRLRDADLSEEAMNQRVSQPSTSKTTIEAATQNEGMLEEKDSTHDHLGSGKDKVVESTLSQVCDLQSRPDSFPECNDSETLSILREAKEMWNTSENDHLILPNDCWLISDFLFLLIRQLKVAFSDGTTSRRQTPTAGLCCLHCIDSLQVVSPSGRSFPSAPDNFASSLNNSLHAHMQACSRVPPPIKQALLQLRKLHSAQCSSLRFGSQRRYFNLLHERLKQTQRPHASEKPGNTTDLEEDTDEKNETAAPAPDIVREVDLTSGRQIPVASDVSSLGYIGIMDKSNSLWLCTRCRMVPLPFRVPGSCIAMDPHAVDQMQEHNQLCAGDAFQLHTVAGLLRRFLDTAELPLSVLHSKSFQSFIRVCVAGVDELEKAFGRDAVLLLQDEASEEMAQIRREALWSKFSGHVKPTDVLEAFQTFAEEHRVSPNLVSHPHLLNFVLFIAPGLKLSSA